VAIRDVKFGTKQFIFELSKGTETLTLSAAGESEKQDWMRALNKVLGNGGAEEEVRQIALSWFAFAEPFSKKFRLVIFSIDVENTQHR
jgi:hypothetical protein